MTTDWLTIDSSDDLAKLSASVTWEHARPIAFSGALHADLPFVPADVSRSGYQNWNVHLLFETDGRPADYLELLLIDCDAFSTSFLADFHLDGRVDTLKRIEVSDASGATNLRCSRLAYRFNVTAPETLSGFRWRPR